VLWCWVRGRRTAAGALAGLLCLVKPQFAVLLLWGLLRRQGRFVLAGTAAAAAGLVLSLALFGLPNHLNCLRVLSFLSHHGESFYPNQSINGLLHRLLGNGNNLEWNGTAFPPYHPVVHAGTAAGSAVLLALGLLGPLRRQGRGSALDLGVAALCCTLASPVAWEHHYGVFLPVYAVLYAALRRQGAGPVSWLALGTSFALTGNLFLFLNRWTAAPFNLLQSYAFFGGLLALGLVYRFRGAVLAPLAGPTS
jgi:alpha-1,2-mannosyltransferase